MQKIIGMNAICYLTHKASKGKVTTESTVAALPFCGTTKSVLLQHK